MNENANRTMHENAKRTMNENANRTINENANKNIDESAKKNNEGERAKKQMRTQLPNERMVFNGQLGPEPMALAPEHSEINKELCRRRPQNELFCAYLVTMLGYLSWVTCLGSVVVGDLSCVACLGNFKAGATS